MAYVYFKKHFKLKINGGDILTEIDSHLMVAGFSFNFKKSKINSFFLNVRKKRR